MKDYINLVFKTIFCLIISITIINIFKWARQKHSLTLVKDRNGVENYVRNMDDKEKAAELMTEIKRRLKLLIDYIKKKGKEENDRIKQITDNLNINEIKETDLNEQATSYSVNKGRELSICLRNKKDPMYSLHDINTLMFVVIHETAHLMSKTYGHNAEFLENFKYLLKNAIECNVYYSINYEQNNAEYCGMSITSNPLMNN